MMDRLALVVLLVLAATPAFAASDSEARLCRDARLEPPLRVEACTRALALRDLTKQQHLLLLGARASALDELGDHGRAIADFDSAIVLAPDDAVLHLNRGAAKIHDGRPTDAIADYDAAIRIRPDWHLPYFNRAVALTDLGQRAAALKDYERAIRLKPDDAWIYVGQGDVLAASGDPARAIESYDKALALRPELDDPRAKRAGMLLRLDRPAEALPEFDRVLVANPSKAQLWRARGEAKFQLARYVDAAADLEHAHALSPRDGDVRRALARAYLGAGDGEAAWRTLSPELDTTDDAADLTLAGDGGDADGSAVGSRRTGEARHRSQARRSFGAGDPVARSAAARRCRGCARRGGAGGRIRPRRCGDRGDCIARRRRHQRRSCAAGSPGEHARSGGARGLRGRPGQRRFGSGSRRRRRLVAVPSGRPIHPIGCRPIGQDT